MIKSVLYNKLKVSFISEIREKILFKEIEEYIKLFDNNFNIECKKWILTQEEIDYNHNNFQKFKSKIFNNIKNNYQNINFILDSKISEYGIIKQIYNNHFSKTDNYIKSYCFENNIDFRLFKDILEYNNNIENIKSFIKELENNNIDKYTDFLMYVINYYENHNIKWGNMLTFIYAFVDVNACNFEIYFSQYCWKVKDILFKKVFNKEPLIKHYNIKQQENQIKNNNIITLYALHCFFKNGRRIDEL